MQPENQIMNWLLNDLKFTFSEKATNNLTVCSNRQIDGKDFVTFCGILRKHELYFVLVCNKTRIPKLKENKKKKSIFMSW